MLNCNGEKQRYYNERKEEGRKNKDTAAMTINVSKRSFFKRAYSSEDNNIKIGHVVFSLEILSLNLHQCLPDLRKMKGRPTYVRMLTECTM